MLIMRTNFFYRRPFYFLVLMLLIWAMPPVITASESDYEWQAFQERYHLEYVNRLHEVIDQSIAKSDTAAEKKWRRILSDIKQSSKKEIKEIHLPDIKVRDACVTCHGAMDNTLFIEAEQPHKAHPPEILKDHPIRDFGCTLCHQGQGSSVSVDSAHGEAGNFEKPRVPKKYMQGLCIGCHETPFGLKGAEKAATGRQLFLDRGCFGCHVVKSLGEKPFMSTSLEGVAVKVKDKKYMAAWIRKPADIRPGTRMPSFRLNPENISDVVAFLQSLKKTDIPLSEIANATGNLEDGKRLFTEKGCIGCHSLERGKPGVTKRVPNLADAGIKLAPAWLKTWVEKPAELMPSTPMPLVTLTAEEQNHIIAYVLSLKDGEVTPFVKEECAEGNPGKGKETIQTFGCFGCHEIKAMEKVELVGVPLGDVAQKQLKELSFGNTEVKRNKWEWLSNKMKKPDIYQTAETLMKMPDYDLNDDEIEALTNYYLNNRLHDVPEKYLQRKTKAAALLENGDWMLDRYNCNGCHQITDDSPKPRIDAYFSMKTMAPPRLVGQGARVQSEWLFKYLDKPEELRPWLNIRMPKFNLDEDAKNNFIAYFGKLVSPEDRDISKIPYDTRLVKTDYDPEIIAMGEYRVVTDKCMQCHPVSMDGSLPEDVKIEDLSINLMLSKTRLRFEWIKRFLRDPDKYAGKGTKMPYIYYTPDGVPKMPDPEMWIDYATLYLMFMDKVPDMPEKTSVEDARGEAETDWSDY